MKKKTEIKTILAIDTSCDDTSVAILDGLKVLANIVSSQEQLHKKWGGVVPDIARRAHQENIELVIKEAFARASRVANKEITIKNIDAVAVTYGPGLAIALEVGITKAKELCAKQHLPLIAVNHMEGHLLSSFAQNSKGEAPVYAEDKIYPVIGVLISGGHTELILMKKVGEYQLIGETLDDAIGEANDKVARMLGLGYPGGIVLSELAEEGDSDSYKLPIPMQQDERITFSYSGLKTAVYYMLKKLTNDGQEELTKQQVCDIGASFQKAAVTHLVQKLELALQKYNPKAIFLGGGVVGSAKVRAEVRKLGKKYEINTFVPFSKKLFTDNAAMIGVAAHFKAKRKEFVESIALLDREPRARL